MLMPTHAAQMFNGAESIANDPVSLPAVSPLLELRDISVSLNSRMILQNVTLSLRPNEIMAIIGPSGCGKTTLITTINQMITHTLPGAKVTGCICLYGHQIFPSAISPPELRQKIAMVFQRPNPFPFSIRKNLEFTLKAGRSFRKSDFKEKIEEAMTAVNLWEPLKDRLNEPATCLSGGEQQRLCIARALLGDPDVILFDEPCSALDPISSSVVEDLIAGLKEKCAIMIVTHNLAQARRVSDQCAFFWKTNKCGQVMELGSTERIMSSPKEEITKLYVNGHVC